MLTAKLLRRAVELVPDVLPFLSDKARWYVSYKGGEGSGNFGHEGRPGEVGGSGESSSSASGSGGAGGGSGGSSADGDITAIIDKELSIRNITDHEESMVTDGGGNIILEKSGEAEKVIFTEAEVKAIKENGNAILTHNHPFVASISNGDLEFAATYNLAEMRAVDSKYTYSIRRPSGGWPVTESGRPDIKEIGKMKSTWKREANKYGEIAYQRYKNGEVDQVYINEYATHMAMEAVNKKFGVYYVRTSNP